MGVFAQAPDHEQVVFCNDPATGLRAIIAIYPTSLGPSLGGTRFYPYADEAAALADVLDLSQAMAYKNAVAGLPHGGGKAIIIGDPTTAKSPDLLRAYGRFVASLSGRYYTACDVGTYVEDMDVVAETCPYVTGRSPANGGAGDSSVLTAFGVFEGMRAAAQAAWGQPTLRGRRVGISGVGKVGWHLIGHLLDDGATVVAADVDPSAAARVAAAYPAVDIAKPGRLAAEPMDVYSPCALGHALTDEVVGQLRAQIVCGGANNQLDHAGTESLLTERGILYAPDYVVNAGGVIQVADEINGYDAARARAKAAEIFGTTASILAMAAAEGVPPSQAADRLAEQRMTADILTDGPG